jgi:hypothetical protein
MRRGTGSVYDKWNNMLYLSLGMPRFFSMNAATSTSFKGKGHGLNKLA